MKLLSTLFLVHCLGCVLLITSCAGERAPPATSPNTIAVRGHNSGGEVQLIRFEDGTRCAVFVGNSKGGIDCD